MIARPAAQTIVIECPICQSARYGFREYFQLWLPFISRGAQDIAIELCDDCAAEIDQSETI